MRDKRRDYRRHGKSERASGDLLWYFITHNLISVTFFFLFSMSMGVYIEQGKVFGYTWIQVLEYVFSKEFLELTVFQIFPLSVVSSILGRITAFYLLRGYYAYRDRKSKMKRAMKRWSELNKGINRMGIKFLITALITSFIYSLGIISMLSYAIFDENTLLPLIVIYTSLKIGTYFFVRWLCGSKL